jgi:S1-C subfamily serine protease
VITTTGGWLLVTRLRAGGPAVQAGIRAATLIAAVNGMAIPDQAALAGVLAALDPGQLSPWRSFVPTALDRRR